MKISYMYISYFSSVPASYKFHSIESLGDRESYRLDLVVLAHQNRPRIPRQSANLQAQPPTIPACTHAQCKPLHCICICSSCDRGASPFYTRPFATSCLRRRASEAESRPYEARVDVCQSIGERGESRMCEMLDCDGKDDMTCMRWGEGPFCACVL